MPNFEKIKALISASKIEADDKQKLIDTFAEISDEYLNDVALLLEKDNSWVIKLNDNRKKKEVAFATGDTSLWNQILEEEKAYIADLTYDLD